MQVNLQYAEEHLADLASAVDNGQDVEISRPDKPTLKLVVSPSATQPVPFDRTGMFGADKSKFPIAQATESPKLHRTGLIGSGKGQITYSDDWDSDETNEEIARLFNESKLFPDEV